MNPQAEDETKAGKHDEAQRNGLIQSGTEFAVEGKSSAGRGARFCSRTSISGSSNAELAGLVELQ